MSIFSGLSLENANRITNEQGAELLARARLRKLEDAEMLAMMVVAKYAQAISGKVEPIVKRPEPMVRADGPPRQLTEQDMQTLAPFMAKEPPPKEQGK